MKIQSLGKKPNKVPRVSRAGSTERRPSPNPTTVAQGKFFSGIAGGPSISRATLAGDLQRGLGNSRVNQSVGAAGQPVQRQPELEEEELQMKARSDTMQLQDDLEEEELLQGKFAVGAAPAQLKSSGAPTENRTGMPDSLKSGLENLSGLDLSGVRVHYNSPKPAQLNALAYAQGQEIHVGPGQDKHLPHEGWHAVQQMQGRVKPTLQAQGVPINDDRGLEREADRMGAKASAATGPTQRVSQLMKIKLDSAVAQRRKAKGGSDEVNPEFTTGQDAFNRIIAFYKMNATNQTIGIASQAVCDAAGALWVQSEAPDGKRRIYKPPENKGTPRGWQANFWERPAGGGANTHNFHVSMY